jgi:hypothetical protein
MYIYYYMAYVYRHIRLDKNEPFYIGISNDAMHERANSTKRKNKYWKRIFNKTEIRIEIMLDDLTWEEACVKEREFISLYGRKDLKIGTLVNMTDGGEGLINPSIEVRNKIKTKLLGREPWNKNKTGLYKTSDETKEKLRCKRPGVSEKLKGRKQTPDVIQNRVNKNTGRKRTAETKNKISLATKGKPKKKCIN